MWALLPKLGDNDGTIVGQILKKKI